MALSRMPSRSECEAYFRDCSLTNAISRRDGGWYQLAFELGLPLKASETLFGKTHEAKASEALMAAGHEVRKMSQNFPYDLLVDDCVKVDVKASRLYHGETGNFYSYNLEKPYATCDFYVLYAQPDEGDERVIVVPSKNVIAHSQISIGERNSKYYRYENQWGLIRDAVNYWTSVG